MGFTTGTRDEASIFLKIGFDLDFIQKSYCDKIRTVWGREMVQLLKLLLTADMSKYRWHKTYHFNHF